MSNPLKKITGQTAIYGISSILGRLLNFALVPIYTTLFLPDLYGIVSYLFAISALLMVVFTHGMETSYFRYSKLEGKHQEQVYGTSFWSTFGFTSIVLLSACFFTDNIASLLKLAKYKDYLYYLMLIMALDVFTTIPFARLREEGKARRFAWIKILNVVLNLSLNLFFYILCPYLLNKGIATEFVESIYHPEWGIAYIFISNSLASALNVILLFPQIKQISKPSKSLWKEMIRYALPLMLAGLAYIINEMADKLFLKSLLPEKIADYEIGVYSGCYKLAIFMNLFIQAFRYGAEPFFFAQAASKNATAIYARVMKFFVAFLLLIFLGVTFYIDIIKLLLRDSSYYEGIVVVPILLMANLFFGIYYNLSIWYKLTDKTHYGAYISLFGASITIVGNILMIPYFGYIGSAWATLICYASMCVISYLLGQKHYPVKYDLKRLSLYFTVGLAMYIISDIISDPYYLIRSLMLLSYISLVILVEKPKKSIIFKN